MLLAVTLTAGRVLVLAIAALVTLWWLRRRMARVDPQELMTQRLHRDGEDLYKRWVQNAFLVVTGNCDFAHLPRAEAIRMLSAWWDVHGPTEHRRSLGALADAGRPDNAWDLLRFMLLARIGVAAAYVDDLSAWAEIRPVAIRLQRAYPDWSSMAQAYLLARRQARGIAADGTQDDASTSAIRDNVAHLHGTRWREMPYRLRLGEHDG